MPRPQFDAQVVQELRRRVIQHNEAFPDGARTKLADLKKIYESNYKGRQDPAGAAMAAVDAYLSSLRRSEAGSRVCPTMPADLDLIAATYLGSQEFAPPLRSVLGGVREYKAGFPLAGLGSRRRDALQRAAASSRRLEESLRALDLNVVTEILSRCDRPRPDAQGSYSQRPEGGRDAVDAAPEPFPAARFRLYRESQARLLDLLGYLPVLSAALHEAAAAVVVRATRPKTPDPVTFGVESLAALWAQAHGAGPAFSFKRDTFGDFARLMLGPEGIGFPQASVDTAVRRVLLDDGRSDTDVIEGTPSE